MWKSIAQYDEVTSSLEKFFHWQKFQSSSGNILRSEAPNLGMRRETIMENRRSDLQQCTFLHRVHMLGK